MMCTSVFWRRVGLGAALCLTALAAPVANAGDEIDCWVAEPTLRGHFQGQCVDGKAQGKGRAWQDGGAYYEGDFIAGERSGQGVHLYANGDTYSGQWREDRREGMGRYAYGDQSPWRGDVYFGGWRADMRHGQGTYVFWPSGERFVAEWVDNTTTTPAGPTVLHRQRLAAVLAPVVGQPGALVCSIATEGAGPDRLARGRVQAVIDDRIQVAIETPEVLAASPKPDMAVRWEILTNWMPCPQP